MLIIAPSTPPKAAHPRPDENTRPALDDDILAEEHTASVHISEEFRTDEPKEKPASEPDAVRG